MTLDDIVCEIIENAREDAKRVKAEGKTEATAILKKATANAKAIESKAINDAKRVIETTEKKELASANLSSRRMELDAKKEVIDKVFKALEKRVSEIDSATKKRIYKNMIENAKKQIDAKFVYSNHKDADIVKSVASGLEVMTEDILGGVIVEDKSQSVRINLNFENMLLDMKEEYLKEASDMLFK